MIAETWKDIPGYEGVYRVSNLGNVISLRYNRERLLKKGNTNGYSRVGLTRKDYRYIHRLVAEAFVPNADPDRFKHIDHIDGDCSNNTVSNLRWCNARINCHNRKGHREGTHSALFKGVTWNKKGCKWLSSISVEKQRIHLGVFTSQEEAAQAYDDALVRLGLKPVNF